MSWVRESSTYQAILSEGREEGQQEGRLEGVRRTLVRLGTRRLGAPEAAILARLDRIEDLDVLDRLTDDVLSVSSWADLRLPEGS
jgi:predicted transposase YdaD